jgi:hypothetical protein
MANRDEMSFGKAFADARREMGAGKTFTWRGKSYTTDLAEEAPRRAPTESARPQARRRSTEEVARSASAAIDRAEGRPATRPQRNPRRVPGPNEGTATSVSTPSVTSEPISSMPASVRRAIEDAAPEDRRGATRIAEEGSRKRVPGRAILQAIQNFLRGEGPTDPTLVMRESRTPGMAKGGMVKKGNTDRRKKGMFYDSKSPRGYK